MMSRVARAELRVYSPLSTFVGTERDRWEAYVAAGRSAPPLVEESRAGWATLDRLLYQVQRGDPEAYVKLGPEEPLVCPRRLEIRSLQGLLSVRTGVIPALAESLLPNAQAERAAGELERVRARHPERRSHVICSAWHVPASWFVAVDESERRYEVAADGRPRVSYETSLPRAVERVVEAVGVVAEAGLGDGLVGPLRDVAGWLSEFADDSLVELDYGTVAGLFSGEALADDHSAREAGAAIAALRKGDVLRSGFHYAVVAARWAPARARQSMS